LSAQARRSTRTQPSRGSGAPASPTRRPSSGDSADWDTQLTASTGHLLDRVGPEDSRSAGSDAVAASHVRRTAVGHTRPMLSDPTRVPAHAGSGWTIDDVEIDERAEPARTRPFSDVLRLIATLLFLAAIVVAGSIGSETTAGL